MAKSVRVLLLAVLAVAVSLHAVHTVSAVGFAGAPKAAAELIRWIKKNAKVVDEADLPGRMHDFSDLVEKVIDQANELHYVSVTSITVGGSMIGGGGAVLLVGDHHFPFLTKVAYGSLKKELPAGWSEVGALHRLCYGSEMADNLPKITMVFSVNGAQTTVSEFWHEKSDGSVCLGMLS